MFCFMQKMYFNFVSHIIQGKVGLTIKGTLVNVLSPYVWTLYNFFLVFDYFGISHV